MSKLTATGIVLGTPEFMSPEQIRGKPLDGRSDIYALGVLAFELFTGHLPFPGKSAQETMIARLRGTPQSLRDARPELPAKLDAVIAKCLAMDVANRYASMNELAQALDGVISTRVGYSGGNTPNATYRNHGAHAEAVEIVFDPSRITYRKLLEFFFQIHDPTTKNRQGNDMGTSYRSGIYYTSEAQRETAENTIDDVNASKLWPGKVVTELAPAGDFWEAEPEHQDYLQRYPNGYTCHYVRPDWKLPSTANRKSA